MTTHLEQRPMLEAAQEITERLVFDQAAINEGARRATDGFTAELQPADFGYDTAAEATTRQQEILRDKRIASKEAVITPELLAKTLPLSANSARTTEHGRSAATRIINGRDDRLMVITGPCSVHDAEQALEYAQYVREWRAEYGKDLEVIMRLYTEKPRTIVGWKGLTYDPLRDGTANINLGVTLTRMLACGVTSSNVPIAMERLHGLTPQYLNGLVTYDAIGARNVTDQRAREYASATSSVVGLKNGMDGDVKEVCDAVEAANEPHVYLGMDMSGTPSRIHTIGNRTAHVVLRGGKQGPNYSAERIADFTTELKQRGLLEAIVVDASHGNSNKEYRNQRLVVDSLASQIASGSLAIRGVMLESNLREGKQDIDANPLEYGVSVTDACIDIEETGRLLETLATAAQRRRALAA